MRSSTVTISIVLFLASACHPGPHDASDPLQRSDAHDTGIDAVEASKADGTWDAPGPALTASAEDEDPEAGLSGKKLLQLHRQPVPDRPCGVRFESGEPPTVRFGWDDESRLVILDWVMPDPGDGSDPGLESRLVRLFDDRGRLTDEVYVAGDVHRIDNRIWYQWSDDVPARRWASPSLVTGGGSIEVDPDRVVMGNHIYDYDPTEALLTVTEPTTRGTTEYHLTEPVEPADALLMHGLHNVFKWLGPIDSAVKQPETNQLTGEAMGDVETIEYERDSDDRVVRVGDHELVWDCP